MDMTITSACPTCGLVAERPVYNIGSGPELSCGNCEWCWGADGQLLKPLDIDRIMQGILGEPITCTPERRATLLALARADGQPWTEDQAKSGWDDHMAEIMYGEDADARTP